MQRLISIGMLSAIVGGGYMFLNGLTPTDVRQAIGGGQNNQPQYAPLSGSYPQPSYGTTAATYGGGYQQPALGAQVAPGAQPAAVTNLRAGGVPPPPNGVIRIATFNIQVFGDSKAGKIRGADGKSIVMAYLAAIVQNFDLVAIQEIRTKDQYFIDNWLRDYVNQGGRRFDRVVGPRLGRTNSKEQYAYLYDTAKVELNPQLVYTVQDSPDDLLHREPLVAMFRARGAPPQQAFTFMLVNTHTDPDETDTELDALAQVYDAVRRHPMGEDDVILLGDLNTAVPSSPPHSSPRKGRELTRKDLRALGNIPGIYPVVRNRSTNTAGSKIHDNILINTTSTTEFQGRAGVFDIGQVYGLSQDKVKMLSDHLPVWAEFSVYESGTPGRLATGGPPTQR